MEMPLRTSVSIGGTRKSRDALLSYLDSVVTLYNAADFESLMSMLALTCRENIVVRTCLEAPPSTNNRKSIGVLTIDERMIPYVSQEKTVSSIALVWLLLHSAHPDGVFKIIDRRICYRKRGAPESVGNGTAAQQAETANREDATTVQTPAPTTVLEVMVTFLGFCTTQESLHQALAQVEADQSKPQDPKWRVCTPSHAPRTAPATGTNSPPVVDNGTNSDALAAQVDVLLTRLGVYLGKPNQNNHGSLVICQDDSSEQGQVQGQRRRYLIEFRLQFDEHDLVTHWTTTVLAAEPEETFQERAPFIKNGL